MTWSLGAETVERHVGFPGEIARGNQEPDEHHRGGATRDQRSAIETSLLRDWVIDKCRHLHLLPSVTSSRASPALGMRRLSERPFPLFSVAAYVDESAAH